MKKDFAKLDIESEIERKVKSKIAATPLHMLKQRMGLKFASNITLSQPCYFCY